MQSIYAHPGVHLALGRKGENVARQVVFDLRLWRAAHGAGAVSLCAKRAGDAEPYPCGVTQDEDTAVWVLRAADVDKPGWGNVQLSYYVGDTLAKSQTWRTLVAPSLCACGDPGEVQQGWLDQAGKDAAAAQQGAKDAQEAQQAAEEAAKAAESSADAAAGSSDSAGKSAQDAAVSASAAANAAASANSSQTAAASSASSADGSASAAADSAKAAKEAQGKAEDAEAAAAAAKADAETAASAAKDATEHPPRINEETQTWLIWQDGAYQDTGLPIAASNKAFTFTITPVDGQVSPNLSATRTEMLAALDAGKALLGYWTETRTVAQTTIVTKHEFRLESVNGTGADRGLAFVNYEQSYKSTLYVNGNDTVSFVNKEQLPNPMTKTEAMTQNVGMDGDGRLWTEPGASGDDKFFDVTFTLRFDGDRSKTCDSTYAEILGAIASGKMPRMLIQGANGDTVIPISQTTMVKYTQSEVIGYYTSSLSTPNRIGNQYTVEFDTIAITSEGEIVTSSANSMVTRVSELDGMSGIIVHSCTPGSSKRFRLKIDDSGTISATEVTDTTT